MVARVLGAHSCDLGAHGGVLGVHGHELGAHGRVLGAHGRVLGAHGRVFGAHGRVLGASLSSQASRVRCGPLSVYSKYQVKLWRARSRLYRSRILRPKKLTL